MKPGQNDKGPEGTGDGDGPAGEVRLIQCIEALIESCLCEHLAGGHPATAPSGP